MRFDATDGVELSGLLYEPRRATRRAAIFLHGTGGASVFDSKRTNILAGEFVRNGIAYFPFDNRGAHLLRPLRRWSGGRPRPPTPGVARRSTSLGGGMAYERIRDCVYDIDGAIRFLRSRGYRDLVLIGHSTGANKIAVYDHYRRHNPIRAYVLLGGGDDTGLTYADLGPRRFRSALERARKLRTSEELVPPSISKLPMSWRSLYDMINPDGDYNVFPFLEIMRGVRLSKRPRFRYVRGIRKPALAIYGDRDEYCYGDVSRCVEILSEAVAPNFELAVIEDADHGFSGREGELASLIINWLTG